MRTVGFALYCILSTPAFGSEPFPEQATKFSCSNGFRFHQVPYRNAFGNMSAVWFSAEAELSEDVPTFYSSTEFAHSAWERRETEQWHSRVYVKYQIEVEVLCQDIGRGCALSFWTSSEGGRISVWQDVACEETPYAPKFERLEMEVGREEGGQSLKFAGLLWDFDGYYEMKFEASKLDGESSENPHDSVINTKNVKRYGSSLGFELSLYNKTFFLDSQALVSEKSTGLYEGSYYSGPQGGLEPLGKLLIRRL